MKSFTLCFVFLVLGISVGYVLELLAAHFGAYC